VADYLTKHSNQTIQRMSHLSVTWKMGANYFSASVVQQRSHFRRTACSRRDYGVIPIQGFILTCPYDLGSVGKYIATIPSACAPNPYSTVVSYVCAMGRSSPTPQKLGIFPQNSRPAYLFFTSFATGLFPLPCFLIRLLDATPALSASCEPSGFSLACFLN